MDSRTQPHNPDKQQILFTSALELLVGSDANGIKENVPSCSSSLHNNDIKKISLPVNLVSNRQPAINSLKFPFVLKPDQIKAAEAWISNGQRGSLIYGSGTGKTEIAFECARLAAQRSGKAEFRILLLVPRIVLIEQNYKRLIRYGISQEKIGRYFSEQKESQEIILSTYQSAKNIPNFIRDADMIIFDEVHLLGTFSGSLFSKIFANLSDYPNKALLGLTATIDEMDPRNFDILNILPPVRKYLIKDAVMDGRLAKPIIVPIKVPLTEKEQKIYSECTNKIMRISNRFHRYDAQGMTELLKVGGFPSWQAKAWFLNVRKRKILLASASNKLASALELIKVTHHDQKVMVFSETLESVRKLKQILGEKGVESMIIDSSMPSFKRQKILAQWGSKFYPLLSVHTLEIGYDVPEVDVEIILASTSNMNQVVQRIGRVVRKFKNKEHALVYVICVEDTKDDGLLSTFRRAVESSGGTENRSDVAPAA
jgi:superfamily II DNA or RNA helicase